ncbi:hypothetical protein [Streptomyces sp. NPDC001165]|uniref:hypothetical protein n=1 Tax=Streptomyces sp. NPDC001165 TaxID=3364546 RepID=UPI00369A842C
MGVHAAGFAKPLGFTDAQLFSAIHGSAEDPVCSQDKAPIFRLADELYATNHSGGATARHVITVTWTRLYA